jgi:hypothetical protein
MSLAAARGLRLADAILLSTCLLGTGCADDPSSTPAPDIVEPMHDGSAELPEAARRSTTPPSKPR